MNLSQDEIKAIDELVVQFKNVLPRMTYQLLDKTAYECAAICIKHSIDIYDAERIKAKALIEALEEIKDRKFCHCAEMAELAIKEYNKNNP